MVLNTRHVEKELLKQSQAITSNHKRFEKEVPSGLGQNKVVADGLHETYKPLELARHWKKCIAECSVYQEGHH